MIFQIALFAIIVVGNSVSSLQRLRRSLTSTCNTEYKRKFRPFTYGWLYDEKENNDCQNIGEHDGHCSYNSQCAEGYTCGYKNCQYYDAWTGTGELSNCCFDPNVDSDGKHAGHIMIMSSDVQNFNSFHCNFPPPDESYTGFSQTHCQNAEKYFKKKILTQGGYEAIVYMQERESAAARVPHVAGTAHIGDLTEDAKKEQLRLTLTYHNLFLSGQDTNQFLSLGNHDIYNPLTWANPEPKRVTNVYTKYKKLLKNMEDRGAIGDYDSDSLAYYYTINRIVYINLQMHPLYVGSSWDSYDIKDPYDWLEDTLTYFAPRTADYSGIVLMFHLPEMKELHSNAGENFYYDSSRWTAMHALLKDHNTNNADIPILATFSGHVHERNGYFKEDALEDGYTVPIRHFITGSREYYSFLSIEFHDYPSSQADRYFQVWAHYLQPGLGAGGEDTFEKNNWKTECVHESNNRDLCTEWHFDGNTIENPWSASGNPWTATY